MSAHNEEYIVEANFVTLRDNLILWIFSLKDMLTTEDLTVLMCSFKCLFYTQFLSGLFCFKILEELKSFESFKEIHILKKRK